MRTPAPSKAGASAVWERFSRFIEATLGLHYSPDRFPDLARAMAGAAADFGYDDPAECALWLSSGALDQARLEVLARHLTVGETYFFRDPRLFDALSREVLPALIRERSGRDQRLRLWSAACSSGEEPYSLAIAVRELLPDIADWQVTIVATDINPVALRKGVAGTYTDWSFRGTSDEFKGRYFVRTHDGRYAVRPEIRQMVTFEHLNLVDDAYPTLATSTNAMDIILCRNVLMYLSAAQMRKVTANLYRALADGGWLVVAPSEASQALFGQFETRNFPGAILYRKRELARVGRQSAALRDRDPQDVAVLRPRRRADAAQPVPRRSSPPSPPRRSKAAATRGAEVSRARALYDEGRYGEAADLLLEACAGRPAASEALSLLARALSNQGRLEEALTWCDRWISVDATDASAHYLRGMVLLERGQLDDARRSLQRSLYLQPDLVLGHFALGTVARSRSRLAEAERHFANAMRLLDRLQPEHLLPQSDGLTAGRLAETIAALRAPGGAA